MKHIVLICLLSCAFLIQAQEINFEETYDEFPNLPNGILEAVAWNNTHMVHLTKTNSSCIGIPEAFGIMGLFENGKNYFHENGKLVAKISGVKIIDQKSDPNKQIFAYGKTFSQLLINQDQDISEEFKIRNVLNQLSEIPDSGYMNLLARDLQTSEVLSFMNSSEKANQYNFTVNNFDLSALYGTENFEILSGSKVIVNKNGVTNELGATYTAPVNKSTDYGPAIWDPAPACNFSSRNGTAVSAITIHTVQGSYAGAISWAQNCSSSVSYHYVIRSSDGQITQLVFEADKGWHVGSENPYTIGYEHEGYVNDPSWYTEAMYNASSDLSIDIINSGYGIPGLRTYYGASSATTELLGGCTKIKGHQHFPNQTHTDPGINWDWEKYYRLINNNPSITTITSTSGNFYDTGGSTGDYSDDERELWLFEPQNASSVTLNFTMFDIELDWDYLFIYDGDNIDAPLIGTYTGNNSPGIITSTGGSILVEFRSDCATVTSGWEVSYTSAVGDDIPPTTAINPTSPWITDDFVVNFTDTDLGSGIMNKYYLLAEKQVADNDYNTISTSNFGFETFEDSDQNWFPVSGTYGVNNGVYEILDLGNQNSNTYMALNQLITESYYYTWDQRITSAELNQRAGIHFFCDNPNLPNRGNSYFVYLRENDNKVQIYSVDNDIFNLEVEGDLDIVSGISYHCGVTYNPSTGTIMAFVDDSLICNWTDSSPLTSGGFISLRTGGCSVEFDNVLVFKNRGANISVTAGLGSNELSIESIGASPTGVINSIVLDSANNWSTIESAEILLDFTPPEVLVLNDGTANDIDTFSTVNIEGNWEINDIHSDILEFEYAVGTLPQLDDIVPWTSNGINGSIQEVLSNPIYGQVYHITVRATNNAGLEDVYVSNGQQYLDDLSSNLLTLSNLVLYPNPTSNLIKITGVPNDCAVIVYNMAGSQVFSQDDITDGAEMDLSSLPSGTYNIYIRCENSFTLRKVEVIR